MLTVDNLRFQYKRTAARLCVNHATFEPGAHFLVGTNGSGKSTFLKLLAGLLPASTGTAIVGEVDLLARDARAKQRVGYLEQDFMLREGTRTVDYLEYAAWMHGVSPSQVPRAAQKALGRVDLVDQESTPVKKLSGGMQKRLGIAAELAHGPQILLLDEPTSGLDVRARSALFETARGHTSQGGLLIVATHEPTEIARFDANVHVFSGGQYCGSTQTEAGQLLDLSSLDI